MDALFAPVAEPRPQGQLASPANHIPQSSPPTAPRAPPNSPEPELDNGHEEDIAGHDGNARTIIDVCTSLLSLATTQPEDRANWIRTLRTDAAWLLQLARGLETQQRDEDRRAEKAAGRGQKQDVKGKGREKDDKESEAAETGKETTEDNGAEGEGKGKGKERASDDGQPAIRARDRPRVPLIWRPADCGNDWSVQPTYEESPREVYFGTVEDDAATCQPHMY